MYSVGLRRVRIAAAVVLLCILLNFIPPAVIASQRAIDRPATYTTVFDGPVPYSVTTEFEQGTKKDEVDIRARLLIGSTEYHDSYTAAVTTAFPVRDRGGMTYIFPYRPERRSYPYSDPFALEAVAMDYVGPRNVGGLETYKYLALIEDGDYRAERTFDMERRTGRILDETWTTSGGPVEGFFRMAESSRAEAFDQAKGDVILLRALQVLAWLTRAVIVVTLVWLALSYARR
ncbi:porin PorA family protein [Corynebacterium mayonis]|uniref:porin PorA family protein n=1 Tax=Corynebacterium mayonis TaxID=3062461 RepID=UPI003140C2C3